MTSTRWEVSRRGKRLLVAQAAVPAVSGIAGTEACATNRVEFEPTGAEFSAGESVRSAGRVLIPLEVKRDHPQA